MIESDFHGRRSVGNHSNLVVEAPTALLETGDSKRVACGPPFSSTQTRKSSEISDCSRTPELRGAVKRQRPWRFEPTLVMFAAGPGIEFWPELEQVFRRPQGR